MKEEIFFTKTVFLLGFFFLSCNSKQAIENNIRRAVKLESTHKYEKALEEINQAIILDSFSSVAYAIKGKLLGQMKNYEAANECFFKAINLDKTNTAAFFYKAGLHSNMNAEDSAAFYYTKALESKKQGEYYFEVNNYFSDIVEDEKYVALEVIYYNRGISYYEMDFPDQAKSDFLYSLRKGNNISECQLYIGAILVKQGKKEGCEYLGKAYQAGKAEAEEFLRYYCK